MKRLLLIALASAPALAMTGHDGHGMAMNDNPVVSLVGLQLGRLMGGAVVTESIFAWPGVGRLMVSAIFQRDVPIVIASSTASIRLRMPSATYCTAGAASSTPSTPSVTTTSATSTSIRLAPPAVRLPGGVTRGMPAPPADAR